MNKKLRIAVIMQSPDMGGAEIYMLSLIREFELLGHLVILATNKGKFFDRAFSEKIKLRKLPMILDVMGNLRGLVKSVVFLPFALLFYLKLLSDFRKKKIDLILMSGFSEKLLVTFLSVFFRIPIVWIEYGRLETVFKRNFYIPKLLYVLLKTIPKKIIVPSLNTFNSLRTSAFVSEKKLKIIPCGVLKAKKRYEIPKELTDKFIVGSVSRLTREKGQEYLIKAIPHVLKKVKNSYFIFIGDGPDRKYFENLILRLGVETNVKVLGFVKDINYYYSLMDVFVFPTVWELEGFGLVTAEAMMNKIPVIGSDIGPVPEIIDNNKTGIIVNPSDEVSIANAILNLAQNEKLRIEMGQNGYEKAIAKYDIKKITQDFLNIFYEAI